MLKKDTELKIFCVAGTRPEYIKLFPVYKELKKLGLAVSWVSSAQHLELVKELEEFFEIKPDYVFDLSQKPDRSLAELSAELLTQADFLFKREKPDLVIVQGDTATTLEAAMAAFNNRIPVAHIEAGLRTHDLKNPFPEELNRRIVSQISSFNFCPTQVSLDNLINESCENNYLVGNTVIDSLKECLEKIELEKPERPYVLVTSHRRENIEAMKTDLAPAISELAALKPDYDFVIKLHANPKIKEAFSDLMKESLANIRFVETQSYPVFVKLMAEAEFILTDSGGVQEEAPYLLKPILVFRDKTERMEAVDAGAAKLIGTKKESVKEAVLDLMNNPSGYEKMITGKKDIFGDGNSASKTVDILLEQLSLLLSQ